ncbi:hypothetical protein BDY19DRAFT_932963 [Irpex rosettiformis]|uniref:Uncharacterized protein n=1 Tax=Irpex rosettiformis TaxID=378272 RepID=A0ACB8U9U8_9APHY|nr:hypothetical protein BDY19DRAFT_932963 [Irpex rosettiformis]
MSKTSKSLTLSRIEDLTLGAFAYVPVPSTLEHLNAYLNTWQGTEKSFAILQYALQLLVPFLKWRANIQYKNGARASPISTTAPRLAKLAGLLSDARALFSLFGVLPIIQWLSSIERKAPATRSLLTIERIQAWSMLLFYPLDHTRYLLSHSVVNDKTSSALARISGTTKTSADGTTSLDAGKISRLSCQLWLLYTIMQLGHLREDKKILVDEARSLSKSKALSAQAARAKVQERLNYLWPSLLTNICDLFCALHWSLENGFFKNSVYPDLLMFISSVVGWRNGFRAIRAAAPAVAEKSDVLLDLGIQAPIGLDAGLDEI